MWFACKSTSDSKGGRAHNPLPLSTHDRGAGKRSVLVSGTSTPVTVTASVKRACERKETSVRDGWKLHNRSSVLSCERCYCHQVFFSSNPHFCTSHATVLHSGPPTTVLPQRHAEEDFLALVRHNAATKLEMERWPPVLKKRGVRKPTVDEHYTQALCNWVATLEAPPADLPQAKRPGWWRHDMSLFGERSAPPDGAEAVAAVEPVRSKRAYHQPSRELRLWVVDCALLRHMQKMGQQDDRGPPGGNGCRMSSDLASRRGHCDGGWTRTRRKAANREMLSMRSFPFCE